MGLEADRVLLVDRVRPGADERHVQSVGLVTPWIVRSPVTLGFTLAVGVTLVEVKVIFGNCPASSHCALFSSSLSFGLVVSTDATER